MQTYQQVEIEERVGRLLDRVVAAAATKGPDQPIYRVAGIELGMVRDSIVAGRMHDRATLPRLRRVRETLALANDATPLSQAASAIITAVAGS